ERSDGKGEEVARSRGRRGREGKYRFPCCQRHAGAQGRSPRRRRHAGKGLRVENRIGKARLSVRGGQGPMDMTRRGLLKAALAGGGGAGAATSAACPWGVGTPQQGVPTEKFDVDSKGIQGWTTVDGQWVVEDMTGAPVGKKVLVQKATKNAFNVIVAPSGPYSDVDVSVKFDPLSGKEDASGGIVFRFNDGKYYVVRANGLENNFRLYYYDRGRRQLASASMKAPPLGQWHMLRVIAIGDHIQAWLDGTLYLDHRDSRFKSGRVGLWTKADSITAFSDLTVRGVVGGG